tara:strand:+ start:893 stop:1450 length:558 start_codon:yes stop_codon:yes gene_type:complete
MSEKSSPQIRGPKNDDEIIQDAMHELPYGIYVIGSKDTDGKPNAMIADWVMQVSFEPRLVAVSFESDSTNLNNIRANRSMTINLLDEDSMNLARSFLQPTDASKIQGRSETNSNIKHDKLSDIAYVLSDNGCAILNDALMWLELEADQFFEIGDHVLVVGKVIKGDINGSGEPLTSVLTGWSYSG